MTRQHTRPHTRTILSLSALALLITGSLLYAGPLNPPAGPVTSTNKTLAEVEPRTAINAANTPGDAIGTPSPSLFKITLPGSYYLTSNITGVVGKHGIEITASGVTLDLNGFDLAGIPAMGAFDGVSVTLGSLTNIAVVNGSVRNWGDEGVDLGSFIAINCRVEGVLASSNTGDGITTGAGSTVTTCSAFQNSGNGIDAGLGNTVANCSASFNAGTGLDVGNGSTVSNCSAYQNTGNGIRSTGSATVSNCSAELNRVSGISVGASSTVADCIIRVSTLDGILCSQGCVIRGNTCTSNGNAGDGAGIHATLGDNRIEGNNCTDGNGVQERGIDVDAAGNIIIRNTCAGNTTNWTIAANNVCGPILDRTAPASAAISGNSAPSSLASTDPNANFSY